MKDYYGFVDNSPSPIEYEGEFEVGSTFTAPDPILGDICIFTVENLSETFGRAYSNKLGVNISKVDGKWCNNRFYFEKGKERSIIEGLLSQ